MSINFISPSGRPITIQVPTSQVADRVTDIIVAGGSFVKVLAQSL